MPANTALAPESVRRGGPVEVALLASLIGGVAACVAIGAGLVCVALGGGRPCRAVCMVPLVGGRAACTASRATIADDGPLYAAAIDTLFRPRLYASPSHPRGVVLLEAATISGLASLDAPSIDAELRRRLRTEGDALIAAYRTANAAPSSLRYRSTSAATQIFLDSTTIAGLLAAGAGDPRGSVAALALPTGVPFDALPGVLAMSRAGFSEDGSTALLFAVLRSGRASPPAYVRAASFLVMRREGGRWVVADEIPVTRTE